MQALEFWKTVTMDKSNLLEQVLTLLNEHGIRYCVVGGVAVNAYVEPVVTLDLDLAVATDQLAKLESVLSQSFNVKSFPHSLNVTLPDSKLRVQFQTDPQFTPFVERATEREVMDLLLPVASLEDVLQSKVWAAQDATRRPSKHLKDLADIARLLESYPELRTQVPKEILEQLGQYGA